MIAISNHYCSPNTYAKSYVPSPGANPVATPEYAAYLDLSSASWTKKLAENPNAKPGDDAITFEEFMDKINDPKIDNVKYSRPMPSKYIYESQQNIATYHNEEFEKRSLDIISKAYKDGLIRLDGNLVTQKEMHNGPFYRKIQGVISDHAASKTINYESIDKKV